MMTESFTRGAIVVLALTALASCSDGRWLSNTLRDPQEDSCGFLSVEPNSAKNNDNGCSPREAKCMCGPDEDRRETIIRVKQCMTTTNWGLECDSCVPAKKLCCGLQNCAACERYNPRALCSKCPPGRFGSLCQDEVPCQMPNVSDNLVVQLHRNKRKKFVLVLGCTEGRVLVGHKRIKCLESADGKYDWNRNVPSCVLPKLCSLESLPPQAPVFTRVRSRTPEWLTYECAEGYRASGSISEIVYKCDNGVWHRTGQSVQCEPGPRCKALPQYTGAQPVAGTPVQSVYLAGQRVAYACQDGFEPLSNQRVDFSLICEEGLWKGQDPECVLKGCRKLLIEDGDVVYEGSTSGNNNNNNSSSSISNGSSPYVALNTMANVSCHDGFSLNGISQVRCSHTSLWDPLPPRCEVQCQNVTHGKKCTLNISSEAAVVAITNETEILPGQMVTFGCKKGSYRKLNGVPREKICLFNGTLFGTGDITCEKVPLCGEEASGGNCLCQIDTQYDSRVTFCKGKTCTSPNEHMVEPVLDLPHHLMPRFSTVKFFCNNSSHYTIEDPSEPELCGGVQCHDEFCAANSTIKAPRCNPVCGRNKYPKQRRIFGGQDTNILNWPWQAALFRVSGRKFQFVCGATLIYENWALTAAHCVTVGRSKELMDVNELRLTYGSASMNESSREAVRNPKKKYSVKEVIIHDQYDNHSLDSDIALLQLKHPISLSDTTGLACLPESLSCSQRRLVPDKEGVATGWGRTANGQLSGDEASETLLQVNLHVENSTECNRVLRERQGVNTDMLTDNMICAKSGSGAQDTADGDSGGPLVFQGPEKRWIIEGIISWGEFQSPSQAFAASASKAFLKRGRGSIRAACRDNACYGVYTRVASYLDWIAAHTGEARHRYPCY